MSETDNKDKAASKRYDAWEDLRDQDTAPFDIQRDNKSGVIDVSQAGSLFEVLSETAAKEQAAAMAEWQSDTIPLHKAGKLPFTQPSIKEIAAPAGAGAASGASAGQGAAGQDAAEHDAAGQSAVGQGAAGQDAAEHDAAGQSAVGQDAAGQSAAVKSAGTPAKTPAAAIASSLAEVQFDASSTTPGEASDDASDEATDESSDEATDEEGYSHPFFDLPPLERSLRYRKGKSRRSAGDDEHDGPEQAGDAERSRGFELWKVLLAVLLCMLSVIGSYFVGQVFGATLVPDEPILIMPPEEEASGEAPLEESKDRGPQMLTILVVGTDEREKGEQARSDTIILAALNLDTRDIHMVSIPRDTRTVIADSNEVRKINHAHAIGGPELLVKTVEQLLGVNVHYYVETNFKGFANCVDILGGIDYTVERRMLFIEEGIDLYPGQQKLDGDKALQYVRWRGDPRADIGRVERQQKFIKAFIEQAISLGTVVKLPSLVGELRENVRTDMTAPQMVNLALKFADIRNLSFDSATLPGEAKTISGGAYWVMDEEAAKELILSIFDPQEPELETEEEPEPEPEEGSVSGLESEPEPGESADKAGGGDEGGESADSAADAGDEV